MNRIPTPIWVFWWPDNEPHGHMILCSDGTLPLSVVYQNTETFASELAEQMLICNEDRHNHHGKGHSMTDAMDAFKLAVEQLQNKDFAQIWHDLHEKIRLHKLWGGPVPAAILQFNPEDPSKEQLVVPGPDGMPRFYDTTIPVLKDIMPEPHKVKGVSKHPSGLGHYRHRKNP